MTAIISRYCYFMCWTSFIISCINGLLCNGMNVSVWWIGLAFGVVGIMANAMEVVKDYLR